VDVPAHWIAGTYEFGQPVDDIEGDLEALKSERSKNWILK
jgi:hypothetical protein